jgi:hypothetical protein
MALDLAHQRCFNHARREAAARCPECGRYYCRECVTEHEDRVVCAPCLARLTGEERGRGSRWGLVFRAAECLASLVMLWVLFYVLGEGLLALPSSFHDGAIWQAGIGGP